MPRSRASARAGAPCRRRSPRRPRRSARTAPSPRPPTPRGAGRRAAASPRHRRRRPLVSEEEEAAVQAEDALDALRRQPTQLDLLDLDDWMVERDVRAEQDARLAHALVCLADLR